MIVMTQKRDLVQVYSFLKKHKIYCQLYNCVIYLVRLVDILIK